MSFRVSVPGVSLLEWTTKILMMMVSFVHAPHSRERLKITREMLTLLFTFHQIMPAFLDFLSPFGRQEYPKDFRFSALYHENGLTKRDEGPRIPELGRSGREIRICYNLMSVEPSKRQENWPWSIRQTAVYHSFDVETRRANWIIVKGDQLMKKRIMSATAGSGGMSDLTSFGTLGQAFASTFATHLILCDWASENWRWYINYLEEMLQDATKRHLSFPVLQTPPRVYEPTRTPTIASTLSRRKSTFSRSGPQTPPAPLSPLSPKSPISPASTFSFGPYVSPAAPQSTHGWLESDISDHQQDFSYSDLQRVQYLEEKANDALLVLEADTNILVRLRGFYQSILKSGDSPDELSRESTSETLRVEEQMATAENELRMQQSRVKTLLSLLAERKKMVGFGKTCVAV